MTVYHVGPQCPFISINSALTIASTGDTILIEEGIYNEVLYMNNKIVNLIGRTDRPLEGAVKIVGYASAEIKSTLQIKWENSSSITMLVEGISFKSVDDDIYGIVFFDGDAGNYNTSGLNITFNKCIFDGTNFTGGNPIFYYRKYYPYQYNNLTSFYMINCDVYLPTSCKFVHGRLRDCTRSMKNCRLNSTPTGYDSGGSYSDIFPLGSFDYISTGLNFAGYGPKYSDFLSIAYPKFYSFSGIVKEVGEPVSRNLRFFRKDNDVFLGSTDSDVVSGSYSIETSYGGEHYIICLDHINTPYYNDLIRSKCFPKTDNIPLSWVSTNILDIVNPGVEFGDLTGWNIESGSNIVKTDYKHSGNYSFGTGLVSQRVDLLAHGATSSGIDVGLFCFNIHYWRYYYYSDHYDINRVGTRLLDENEVEIGSAVFSNSNSPVVGAWVEDTYNRPIVSGTRYVDILVSVSNNTGYYNYYNRIDDITCYLTYRADAFSYYTYPKIKYHTLTNPGFIPSLSGWTTEAGAVELVAAGGYGGSSCASFRYQSGISIIKQRVDLSLAISDFDFIDQESIEFFVSGKSQVHDSVYWYMYGLRFLDAVQTQIGSDYYSSTYNNAVYEKHIFNVTVVSGTRYVDVLLKGYGCYMDNIVLWSKEI